MTEAKREKKITVDLTVHSNMRKVKINKPYKKPVSKPASDTEHQVPYTRRKNPKES